MATVDMIQVIKVNDFLLCFLAVKALQPKQWSGKIIVKTKNNQHKLTIPYQASVLHGYVAFELIVLFVHPQSKLAAW